MTVEEALTLARDVVAGKSRSYVQDSQALAAFVIERYATEARSDSLAPTTMNVEGEVERLDSAKCNHPLRNVDGTCTTCGARR